MNGFRSAVGAVLLCATSAAMSAAVFTSQAAWQAAAGGVATTDTFSTDIAGAASIVFGSGVVSAGSGAFEDFNFNRVAGGVYQGAVDGNGTGGFDEILWTFASPILGLAADWSSTALGDGVLGIAGDFDGTGELVFRPVDALGGDGTGFFGIVGTAQLSSVRLIISPAGSSNNEEFTVDNLSFAVAPAHQVPAPGTLSLAGLALAALGALHGRARHRSLAIGHSAICLWATARSRGGSTTGNQVGA